MVFSAEQELSLAIILAAIEDYYMEPAGGAGDTRDPEEVERNRVSAGVFFEGDSEESLYSVYADILGVPSLPPEEIASNLRKSNRKMGGRIKKMAMTNIIGEW